MQENVKLKIKSKTKIEIIIKKNQLPKMLEPILYDEKCYLKKKNQRIWVRSCAQ